MNAARGSIPPWSRARLLEHAPLQIERAIGGVEQLEPLLVELPLGRGVGVLDGRGRTLRRRGDGGVDGVDVGEEERAVRVIQDLIRSHPGPTGVLLRLSPVQGFRAVYRIGAGGVAATADLDRAAVEALGPDAVRWKAKRSTGGGVRARRA